MPYLLSDPAAEAVRALVSNRGGYALEPRRVAPPTANTSPLVFECRFSLGSDNRAHLFCYLPPGAMTQTRSPVFLDGEPCEKSASQSAGTSADPWADLGAISSGNYRLVLGFELTGQNQAPAWRLGVVSLTQYPPWMDANLPWTIILRFGSGTFDQIRRGGLDLFSSVRIRGLYVTDTGLYPSSSIGTDATFETAVNLNGTIRVGGNVYAPANIRDGDGNTITVLKKN